MYIKTFIIEHAAELIIGTALVIAFIWLYWLVWRTSKHDTP